MVDYFDYPQFIHSGTRCALNNYWLLGLPPGSFVTALLQGNLFRAAASADYNNSINLCAIAQWVQLNAPAGSIGSCQAVDNWIRDVDNIRTTYAQRKEREHLLRVIAAAPKDHHDDFPF
jgi:hypothetical protein